MESGFDCGRGCSTTTTSTVSRCNRNDTIIIILIVIHMITFIVFIIIAAAAACYSGMNHVRRMMIHPTARYKTVIVERDNFHHHGSMDF